MVDEPNEQKPLSLDEPKIVKSRRYSSQFQSIVHRLRSANLLLLLTAAIQITTGLSLVYLSILGHIYPLWLATVMSMLGSVATMVGAYLWYDIMRDVDDIDSLVKNAIKRVINSQN